MKAKIKVWALGMMLGSLVLAACEKENNWLPQNHEQEAQIRSNGSTEETGPEGSASTTPLFEYKDIILYPRPKLPIPDPGPWGLREKGRIDENSLGGSAGTTPLFEYKDIILYPRPKLPIPDPGPWAMPEKGAGMYVKEARIRLHTPDPEPDPWKR